MNWPTAFTIVSLCVAASLLLIVMVRESSDNLRAWAELHDASIKAITETVVAVVKESLAPSMPSPEPPTPSHAVPGMSPTETALRAEFGDAAVDRAKNQMQQGAWYLEREAEHEADVDPLDLSTPLDHFNPYGQLDDDPDNPQPPNEAYPEVTPQRADRAMSVPPGFDPIEQIRRDAGELDQEA